MKSFYYLLLFSLVLIIGCLPEGNFENNPNPTDFEEIDIVKLETFDCEVNKDPFEFNSQIDHEALITTEAQLLEHVSANECIPVIDFSQNIILYGSEAHHQGITLISEKLEENNQEVVYTLLFKETVTQSPDLEIFHVVLKKQHQQKNIRVVRILSEE